MDRNKKERVVAELNEKLKNTKLAILTGYTGMNVSQMTELRNELRKADSELRVIKNSLLKLAAKDTEFSLLDDYLKGPLALLVNSEDAVQPAKVLVDFAKKNAKLDIKAGVLEGKFLSTEQINALASLPTKEVLLAKLLSVFVGVQTQLVTVLSGVPRGFVQVLEAHREKKEKEQ